MSVGCVTVSVGYVGVRGLCHCVMSLYRGEYRSKTWTRMYCMKY